MKGRNEMKKMMAMAMVYLTLFFSLNVAWAGGGSGGSNSSTNSYLTRLNIEAQLRQQIVTVTVSIWNATDNYYAQSSVGFDGWAELKIEKPNPGAYSMFVSEQIIKNGSRYSVFEHRSEIIIKEGENIFSPKLTLIRELPVTFELPEDWTSQSEFNIQVTLPDGNVYGPGWSTIDYQRRIMVGFIPVDATGVTVDFKGKQYTISTPFLLNAMAYSNSLELATFPSKNLASITVLASIMENYLTVPTDYKTIQGAIDAASLGQTIVVKSGTYSEQIQLKNDVSVVGDTACPQCVIVESNESHTIKAEIGGNYSLSGITIRNGYTGQKNWSTAAVLTDLGPHLTMDHCIVKIESTGTADAIVGNYSDIELSNITLLGNASVNGIRLYNHNSQIKMTNLLFSVFKEAFDPENSTTPIKNSLFWFAPNYFVGNNGNVAGDSQLDYNYYLDIQSPAVKSIMAIDGNYPGAMRPMPGPQINVP